MNNVVIEKLDNIFNNFFMKKKTKTSHENNSKLQK